MSKIGKKPINIPEDVKVSLEGSSVFLSGPKGELKFTLPEVLTASLDGQTFSIKRKNEVKQTKSLHGLFARLVENAVHGVQQGWGKTLEMVGAGYRAKLEGENLILSLGFSHQITIEPANGIMFSIKENKITVAGVDRYMVGQVAANIRKIRPPEPYQGKGVRYEGEVVRRKPGKSAKTTSV